MDQTASACCEEGHALHLDCRDLSIRQIPFDLASEGLSLLVVDSRVKHALGDGAYAERREGCEEGARQLGVPFLRDVAYEDLSASLSRLSDERIHATSATSSPTTTGSTRSSFAGRGRRTGDRPDPDRGPRLPPRRSPHLLPGVGT